MFSKAELEALTAAADGMPLEGWFRHVLLTAAGAPEELDGLDEEQVAPALPAPATAASPPAADAPAPTLLELARKLDELGTLVSTKLAAFAGVLEHIRDSQAEWHKAILAEVCAHTAFPDERARRLGLAKAGRDVAAAEARIAQAVARAGRERRARAQAGPEPDG
jgi:hypothetical protein